MTDKAIDLDATMEAMNGMPYTLDGVTGALSIFYTRGHGWRVTHRADANGRRHETYRQARRELGDDYSTDLELSDEMTKVWQAAEALGLIR